MTVQSGTTKYNCVITNVDLDSTTAQGTPSPIVEGAIKGKIVQLSIYDTPVAFRWPVVGETWTVYQQNGSWYLGNTWENTDFQNVNPGDIILNNPTGKIYNLTNIGLQTLNLIASLGNGTLVAGTAIISTPDVTTNSYIFLTPTSSSENSGVLSVGTKSAGVSFVVNSSNVEDTATFNWMLLNS